MLFDNCNDPYLRFEELVICAFGQGLLSKRLAGVRERNASGNSCCPVSEQGSRGQRSESQIILEKLSWIFVWRHGRCGIGRHGRPGVVSGRCQLEKFPESLVDVRWILMCGRYVVEVDPSSFPRAFPCVGRRGRWSICGRYEVDPTVDRPCAMWRLIDVDVWLTRESIVNVINLECFWSTPI